MKLVIDPFTGLPTFINEDIQVHSQSGGGHGSSSGTGVQSIVAGTNVSVNNADPLNPIVSASGGAGSGITRLIAAISSPTTAGSTASVDYVYLISGTTTLTLPTAVGNTNQYSIKNTGTGTVTVATTSAQTIDGGATASLPEQYSSIVLYSDNSNWYVF